MSISDVDLQLSNQAAQVPYSPLISTAPSISYGDAYGPAALISAIVGGASFGINPNSTLISRFAFPGDVVYETGNSVGRDDGVATPLSSGLTTWFLASPVPRQEFSSTISNINRQALPGTVLGVNREASMNIAVDLGGL